jgi:NADH-quinone oxidoreductase subunit L
MSQLSPIAAAALCAPLFPALAFLLLGLIMLVHRAPPGVMVARLVTWALAGSVLATFVVAFSFVTHDDQPIVIAIGSWFRTEGYHFEATLLVDKLSAPMMFLTASICGLIARFTSTYLVGEPGEARFYLLLSMFCTGMFVLVMAGSLDLLVAGWELVGMSSMLLIGFFVGSTFPVRNALRTFSIYRACDIGLLVGTVLMHHYAHTSVFQEALLPSDWPHGAPSFSEAAASLTVLCLFWAACGKSALFPVGNWLPRAMEGPTPSSAIFYGALSVHAGAYLMLRVYPIIEHATTARIVIFAVGAITALSGTLVQRAQTDIKSQLAYAVSTQVGVIFVEIALGFPRLALVHLIGHALIRTLQLLRAPNVIHDVMMLNAAAGTHQLPRREFRPLGSARFGRWLYHFSFSRMHLDAFWDRFLSRPLLGLSRAIDRGEQHYISLLVREPPPEPPPEPGVHRKPTP